MEEEESFKDWLPEGWTVEVRVRKNGKKDKCYSDPSNELKFHSKPEVLRYLEENGSCHNNYEVKKKDGINLQSATNLVVEKAVAEGLPPGWIKETRVKKKGRKTRRDPYYIDPVSGHAFRSMKEVLRYLETGDLGRSASKQKLPFKGEDRRLGGSKGVHQHSKNESLKLGADDIPISNPADCIPELSRHTSDQRLKGAAVNNDNLADDNLLEQREKEGYSSNRTLISTEVDDFQEKLPAVNGLKLCENAVIQQKRNKMDKKRLADLPRRTSKRLAGVKADSLPELGKNNQDCLAPIKQLSKKEANMGDSIGDLDKMDKIKADNQASQAAANQLGKGEPDTPDSFGGLNQLRKTNVGTENPGDLSSSDGDLNNSDEHFKSTINDNTADEMQEVSASLSARDPSPSKGHACQVAAGVEGDDKCELLLDSSLQQIWMDPCIEFAVKTLTGAIPIVDVNRGMENPVSPQQSHDASKCSSLDSSFGEIWTDPCFEFAVKTLTGEIPMEEDLRVQKFDAQSVSSSGPPGQLPSVRLDDFGRSSFAYKALDMRSHKHHTLMNPALQHTQNISSQNPGTASFRQYVYGGRG